MPRTHLEDFPGIAAREMHEDVRGIFATVNLEAKALEAFADDLGVAHVVRHKASSLFHIGERGYSALPHQRNFADLAVRAVQARAR